MLRSETQHNPARARAAMAGLSAYQAARRLPPPPSPPVVLTAGRACVRDYGGSGRPVLFVPSLVNGAQVLDLLPDASFLRWLATRGLNPLLLDWNEPHASERELSVAGHIETMLLPALRGIGRDAGLVGYCLGGTMALAAAAIAPPRMLALIAAPWRFAGFPIDARDALSSLWEATRPTAEALGLMPIEALQAGFWQLDPARTVAKFVRFGEGMDDAAARAFVALEDWANDGPPLTLAAARELFEGLFAADVTGTARWRIDGRAIDPAAIACPVLDIRSRIDRIVPAASAAGIGQAIELDLGHVGMIVGSRARGALWEPLARWLRDPA